MRWLVWALLLCGIVCLSQAPRAQYNSFPPGVFTGRAALDASAAVFSLTYESTSSPSAGGASPIDFGTLTYGSGCSRVITMVAVVGSSVGTTVTGVTVNSVASTQVSHAGSAGSDAISDIWETNSSVSGSSGDVQITTTGSIIAFSSGTVSLYCLITSTTAAHDNQNCFVAGSSTTCSPPALSVPSSGLGIAVVETENATFTSWTNLTQDAANGTRSSVGHTTSTGSVTITANSSGDTMGVSAASWGP